jgi:peptidoglycan/xylan/chitin deacetylase (PgdA/CDA1 family)
MFNDTVIEAVRHSSRDALDLGDFDLGRLPIGTALQRRAAIEALIPKVKYLPLAEREDALRRLERACGQPALPTTLMMRSPQVRQLHAAGMEIGGHTVRHPILAEMPDDQARREIVQGRDALAMLVDAPIEVFAYPNGQPDRDYDQRHVQMVRELGFRGAVSTARGVATTAADRFQLPRHTPWGRSLATWSWRLLGGLRQRTFATAGAAQPAGSR